MKAAASGHYSFEDIMQLEQRRKVNFINSLSGFKSVALIGSMDAQQKTNLAIFNSFVHLGANPPCIGFISRPDSVERHTLSNILETGYYTINHISESIYRQAHQTAARYAKNTSEFEAVGLTPAFHAGFAAPFVKESTIQLGMQFKEKIPITTNGTLLIVGQVEQVYFPLSCLGDDGFLDLEKAGSITCSGLDSYHLTNRLSRLSYAKPDQVLTEIPVHDKD